MDTATSIMRKNIQKFSKVALPSLFPFPISHLIFHFAFAYPSDSTQTTVGIMKEQAPKPFISFLFFEENKTNLFLMCSLEFTCL